MEGRRLANYWIYLHLDKMDISVLGRPENQQALVDYVPVLAQSIAVGLPDGRVEPWDMHSEEKDWGWRQALAVEYRTGRITIRYDRIFQNRPKADQEYSRPFRLINISIENHAKLDYTFHHYVCRLVDAILDLNPLTHDHHIRRAELAGDTLDPVVGAELFRTMVPHNACVEGWECRKKGWICPETGKEYPNGLKQKAWLAGAEGQYYWGRETEVDKDRKTRRREWNPHEHDHDGTPIYRIELRLGRAYLRDKGIHTHAQLFERMEELYRHNVRFQRPRLEAIRKLLNKCKQSGKHPRFTQKSWHAYQKWDLFSTCAWISDLQKRIGNSVSRLFYTCEYPEIYTQENGQGCDELNTYKDRRKVLEKTQTPLVNETPASILLTALCGKPEGQIAPTGERITTG